MKPLRCFYLTCRDKKNYPQVGKKHLIDTDGDDHPVEGYDYQYADWGKDFTYEIKNIAYDYDRYGHINDNMYPQCLCFTNERLIVKAIVPIVQHSNMYDSLKPRKDTDNDQT